MQSRQRQGFTLIEMLVVVLIMSTVMLVMMPKVSRAARRLSVQSSLQDVGTMLRRTRAVAIQRGRTARFVRAGNVVKILIDSSGTSVLIGAPIDLGTRYKVTVTASKDTIVYDPRGFASGLTTPQKVYLTRDVFKDSLCVSRLGRVSSVLGTTNAMDCVP